MPLSTAVFEKYIRKLRAISILKGLLRNTISG
jgi:hypothetical protein